MILLQSVSVDRLDQLMDGYALHQTQISVAIAVRVSHARLILSEVAKQRTGHPPNTSRSRLGINITEVYILRTKAAILSIQARTNNIELYQQALLVVDDLRLSRLEFHILSNSVALIVDTHTQCRRHTWFDTIQRQGIVAKDITLHEVIDLQVWAWIDSQHYRIQLERECIARLHIDDLSAKRISHRRLRSGTLFRNETERCGNLLPSANRRRTINSINALQRLRIDLEQIVRKITLLVTNLKHDLKVIHIPILVAIVNSKRTVKCLASHRHCLRDM